MSFFGTRNQLDILNAHIRAGGQSPAQSTDALLEDFMTKKISNKREKRRTKRESAFGPERAIISTNDGVHALECGHAVIVHSTEGPNIKRRRCIHCLNNQKDC